MSLKAFHIFFISLSILLTIGFAGWEVTRFFESGNLLELLAGVVSLALAILLIVYGMGFIRKMKQVRMM